ncbi:MAG TPA: sn-glycerol-3-phosphate ABC transporter ATP-binding protein UgpC [Devosiaceae bacterium]|jgi:multiple sugar transport system ATP-binding protein|nr:sn-glycerol-3-phosphate ABC transporter ATP-binding protein UgpC [Devosiaceae bacterium]
MASVELRDVRKAFGSVEIIHNLNLAVSDGEFLTLVGPSGCGKSTLLRMIAGLEGVSDGDVLIGGQRVNQLNPRERNISMVFQSYALYPHMTVRQNMNFNLELARVPKHEAAAKVTAAAQLLEISDLLDRRPAQLSGGQRQRVAMGRAIVRNPDVFLFDEPLSNLDAKLRVQMRAEIKELHQKVGTTAIYVTHDQIEAMTLSDRIVVLNRGRVEQIGTPLELYRRPANTFVAAFIGSPSMNLLDAVVAPGRDGPRALIDGGTSVRLPSGLPVTEGEAITLGLRPEHVVPGSDGDVIAGDAKLVEPTGALTHVVFQVGRQKITSMVDGDVQVKEGEPFQAAIRPDAVHVFERASGSRLD